MSIGQRIGKLRKDNGYSQEYIAEQLNVSRQAVSKWETDASAPDTYNLIALAELFDVSVEYIATGKPSESPAPREPLQKPGMSMRQIIGLILLGAGLQALIIGVLLLSELLLLLSTYLILGGVLCLTVRKRLWFVAMWSFFALSILVVCIFMGRSPFLIFNPENYKGGWTNLTKSFILDYLLWIWAIVATTITVLKRKKKK
ncbi:MAG: helix-turn-helix transcriptional regulator [Clostridia bacterium]|nr:helix-turn-helix transcriptional regulator [Clostridia bacterium]